MFRPARSDEKQLLDDMTIKGVRHWGHHERHPAAYERLVAEVQADNWPENPRIFVLEEGDEHVGFYDLRDRDDHVELLRMFLVIDRIGQGYGRALWDHAVREAGTTHSRMLIVSDPSAEGFYSAMGAALERHQEVAPGFFLGIYWYELGT